MITHIKTIFLNNFQTRTHIEVTDAGGAKPLADSKRPAAKFSGNRHRGFSLHDKVYTKRFNTRKGNFNMLKII